MIEVMAATAADGQLFDVRASDAVKRGRWAEICELPFNFVHRLTFHSVPILRIPWGDCY